MGFRKAEFGERRDCICHGILHWTAGIAQSVFYVCLAVCILSLLFSLFEEPLLRVTVISLNHNDQVLVFNVHHIVSDGWSMGILYRPLQHAVQYELGCDLAHASIPSSDR